MQEITTITERNSNEVLFGLVDWSDFHSDHYIIWLLLDTEVYVKFYIKRSKIWISYIVNPKIMI